MRTILGLFISLVVFHSVKAAPCPTIRVGYTDQARPPFFLGRGPTVPEPAGMAIDLIRRSFKEYGCPILLSRLPPARVLVALKNGDIDFALIGMTEKLVGRVSLPTLPDGALDRSRALHIKSVVFVRQPDIGIASNDARRFFRTHTLGAYREAQLYGGDAMDSLKLDVGAADIWGNLEKLRFGRVDGAMAGLFDESSLDQLVFVRYGDSIVRLPMPLVSVDLTLAASKDFNRSNAKIVLYVWERIRDKWPGELDAMMRSVPRVADDSDFLND